MTTPTLSGFSSVICLSVGSCITVGAYAVGFNDFQGLIDSTFSGSSNRYVALGDSVPFGFGLANADKKSEGGLSPNMGPSSLAYPSLLANDLGLSLSLRSTGCTLANDNLAVSGAPSVINLWSGKDTDCHYKGVPVPPHKAVFPDELNAANLVQDPPALVTIQVGANDIDFSGCLTHLLGVRRNPFTDSTNCVLQAKGGKFTLPRRVQEELSSLQSKLSSIIKIVHEDSPSAQILVLGYYEPVPAQTETLEQFIGASTVCKLLETAQAAGTLVSERAEADYLQGQLNTIIASVVSSYPYSTFVNIASLFSGHEMCVVNSSNVSQSWLFDGVWDAAHPNILGQEAIAKAVESDL